MGPVQTGRSKGKKKQDVMKDESGRSKMLEVDGPKGSNWTVQMTESERPKKKKKPDGLK